MGSITTPATPPSLMTCLLDLMAHDALPSATGRDVRPYGPRALRQFIARGWLEPLPFVDAFGDCPCGDPDCEQRLVERDGHWFLCCARAQVPAVPVDRQTLVRFTVHHAPLIAELRASNPFAPSPAALRLYWDIHLVGERMVGAQRVAVVFAGPLADVHVPFLIGSVRQAVPTLPVIVLTAAREVRLPLTLRDALWTLGLFPVPLVSALVTPDDLVLREDVLVATLGRGAALPAPSARPRLVVDRLAQQAWWDGQVLPLNAQLYLALEALALSAARGETVVGRAQLAEHVWGYPDPPPHSVDVAISALRTALQAVSDTACLQTVKRRGIRLLLPAEAIHVREAGG